MASDAPGDAEAVYRQRLRKRQQSINIVKSTANYSLYSSLPRAERKQGDPRTPSPGPRSSTRQFKHNVAIWSKALHEWSVQTALAQRCAD